MRRSFISEEFSFLLMRSRFLFEFGCCTEVTVSQFIFCIFLLKKTSRFQELIVQRILMVSSQDMKNQCKLHFPLTFWENAVITSPQGVLRYYCILHDPDWHSRLNVCTSIGLFSQGIGEIFLVPVLNSRVMSVGDCVFNIKTHIMSLREEEC